EHSIYHPDSSLYFSVTTTNTGLLSSVSVAATSFIFAELETSAYSIKSLASNIWYILPSLMYIG
ncbi:MAG: hypothetical protein IJ296_08060, partial [Bacteroidales bacterium]|nr:hypothetical protein [Bacteroidales bacterium]